MPLQLIYGRSGSGKSHTTMDKLQNAMTQNPNTSVFLIVPEQYTYSAEKELVNRLGITSPRTVEVLSFKRLAHYTANLVGGITTPRLTPAGRWILLRKIADSLSSKFAILGKLAKQNGFCDVASSIISEFKRYNITPNMLSQTTSKLDKNQALKQKLEDINSIYSAFENAISAKYLNPDDELTMLSKLIQTNKTLFEQSYFFFDGFAGFTPQEFEVIKALMPVAKLITIAFSTDNIEQKIMPTDVFAQQKRTILSLYKYANALNISIKPPIHLTQGERYKNSPELSHIESNLSCYSLHPYPTPPKNVHLLIADSRYAEIEQIACEITQLVRDKKVRFKNITVTARSLDSYEQLIESIFPKYNIPYFMDKKSGVTEHPAAFSLLCAIDIKLKKWNYETVFSYLKSGFAPMDSNRLDLLENYILATGIRGSSWTSQKKWEYLPNSLFEAYNIQTKEEYLTQINSIRNEVISIINTFHYSLTQSENATAMCTAVYDFMTASGMDEHIKTLSDSFLEQGLTDLSAQYRQIWNIIITTLDEINTVAGDDKLSIQQFRDLFKTALEAHDIGIIPSLSDGVTIGSAERSRASDVEYSFVIGINEGVFPLVGSTEGILSDRDRNQLEQLGLTLAPDTSQQAFDELYIAYTALTQPSKMLYASYPVSDSGGGALRPSILVYRLKKLFPKLKETDLTLKPKIGGIEFVNSPSATFEYVIKALRLKKDNTQIPQLWEEVCKWYSEHPNWQKKYEFSQKALDYKSETVIIPQELMEKLMRKSNDGNLITDSSVSRLEQYVRCPFSHFSNYYLKARPRAASSLQSSDLGSFAHKVIEQLSIAIQDGPKSWQKATDDWLHVTIAKICDNLAEEILKQFGDHSARKKALLARLKRMSSQSALIVALHLKRGEFIPLGYELEFGKGKEYSPITLDLGTGKKMHLRGKIDRADTYTDPSGRHFIRVIDYKTGNKSFNISDLYFGLDVQLAVYLDALSEAENAEPCGMLYFRLFDPIVEMPPESDQADIDNEVLKQYKMNGLLLADRVIIEKMDTHAGESTSILPVKYNSDGNFAANSAIATKQQLASMQKQLRKSLRNIAKELTGGNASVTPIKYSNYTACDYCNFYDVCHFDLSVGCRYKVIQPLKPAEAWDKIVEEGGDFDA